jgi:hypothetical protein
LWRVKRGPPSLPLYPRLSVYLDQAAKLADAVQRWFLVFGVNLEAHMILDVIKEQVGGLDVLLGSCVNPTPSVPHPDGPRFRR